MDRAAAQECHQQSGPLGISDLYACDADPCGFTTAAVPPGLVSLLKATLLERLFKHFVKGTASSRDLY